MKWYIDIYVNGILMGINYFKTKEEALEFVEMYGLKTYEIGTEKVIA